MKVMRILVIEDNPGDVRLIREAFRETGLKVEFQVAEDGEQGLALLRQEPPFAKELRPNLILLDLNLPKLDGKQVLAEIKADRLLRSIPVIILSSSHSRDDVVSSYDGYANCYIPKPILFEDFVRVARGINDFWMGIVSLPDRPFLKVIAS
jgi:chemotaxis family two-component system response regulator Rcp1